jgi:hypothetical protein
VSAGRPAGDAVEEEDYLRADSPCQSCLAAGTADCRDLRRYCQAEVNGLFSFFSLSFFLFFSYVFSFKGTPKLSFKEKT